MIVLLVKCSIQNIFILFSSTRLGKTRSHMQTSLIASLPLSLNYTIVYMIANKIWRKLSFPFLQIARIQFIHISLSHSRLSTYFAWFSLLCEYNEIIRDSRYCVLIVQKKHPSWIQLVNELQMMNAVNWKSINLYFWPLIFGLIRVKIFTHYFILLLLDERNEIIGYVIEFPRGQSFDLIICMTCSMMMKKVHFFQVSWILEASFLEEQGRS